MFNVPAVVVFLGIIAHTPKRRSAAVIFSFLFSPPPQIDRFNKGKENIFLDGRGRHVYIYMRYTTIRTSCAFVCRPSRRMPDGSRSPTEKLIRLSTDGETASSRTALTKPAALTVPLPLGTRNVSPAYVCEFASCALV